MNSKGLHISSGKKEKRENFCLVFASYIEYVPPKKNYGFFCKEMYNRFAGPKKNGRNDEVIVLPRWP